VTGAASEAGLTHYDDPPLSELGDVEESRVADRFRFANVVRAWVNADDSDQITGYGYPESGGCDSCRPQAGSGCHRCEEAG
jgi:hypothetical protein